MSLEHVEKLIHDHKVEFVDLRFADMRGVQHHVTFPKSIIDASLFDPSVGAEPMIDDDTNRSYNVLPHPLMVNFQTVTFFFYPHSNGKDVIIRSDPDGRMRLK